MDPNTPDPSLPNNEPNKIDDVTAPTSPEAIPAEPTPPASMDSPSEPASTSSSEEPTSAESQGWSQPEATPGTANTTEPASSVSEPAASTPSPTAATEAATADTAVTSGEAVVVSGGEGDRVGTPSSAAAGSTPPSRKRPLKKFLIVLAVLIVLGGGAAGAYFGYYMNPGVIWSQGMNNSGKALGTLTDYAKQLQTNPPGKGTKMNGDFKAVDAGLTVDGTLNSVSDGKNSQTTGKINAGVAQIGFDLRTLDVANDVNPDLYLKVTGFKGVDGIAGTSVGSLDGQWVEVDHTFFDDLESQQKQGSNPLESLSGKDVLNLTQSMSTTTQQYVFTADSKKALMNVVKRVGKETQDGRSVYHYKVNFNKAHVKAYVGALRDDFADSQVGKTLAKSTGKSVNDLIGYDAMLKSVDNIKSDYTADVWIDTGTRLMHKIRFSDTTNPLNNYFEVGQNYTGGDTYPFLLATHDKQGTTVSDFSTGATIDKKANTLTLKVNITESDNGNATTKVTLNFTVAPNNEAVKVATPQGAKSLLDVMNALGLGDYYKMLSESSVDGTGLISL